MHGLRTWLGMLPLLALVAPAFGQSGAGEQLEMQRLQRKLQDARAELRDVRRDLDELVHLRVAHDLRVPVDVRPALPDASEALRLAPEEQRQLLRESTQRRELFARRLRELQAKGFLEPMAPLEVPAQPDRAGPPEPRARAEERPISPDAIVSLARVPRARYDASDELRIPLPLLLRSALVKQAPRFQLEPAPNRTKAIAALLAARREREALLLLEETLQKTPDSFVHRFLKAQALERLGHVTEAMAVFQDIVTDDTLVDANDKPLPGPWAQSAALAIRHLTWMQRFGAWQAPAPEGLDW